MKRLSYIIVWVLIGLNPTYAASRTSINIENDITTTVESHLPEDSIPPADDRFAGWTDEQFQHYNDSIIAALYPPVTAHRADSATFGKGEGNRPQKAPSTAVSPVPESITIDTSKEVGVIPIISGMTPTGARTYDVAIDVYPGMNGMQPSLSLNYNSQRGNSIVGMGWALSGVPSITRGTRSIYYDGQAHGVSMDNDDAFYLDGMRLIKTGTDTGCILYESEQGNIKAKGYCGAYIMKYFEVFYPDGKKGVFGYENNSTNRVMYPLWSLTDLYGNKIDYTYAEGNNLFRLEKINYNAASIEFRYKTRSDGIVSFCGGLQTNIPVILNQIICKVGTTVRCTYTLGHKFDNSVSLLEKIDYSASGKSFNPLIFYYGNGETSKVFTQSSTQLYEWYESADPSMIKIVRGKFDYDGNTDGLIVLPNYNPYYIYHQHATTFRKSQNYCINNYKEDDKIFLYTGLQDDWVHPMPNLITEKGFVDILCADLEGKQEEYIVKVNNFVNGLDKVTFNVYRSNLYSGMSHLYTRTFDWDYAFMDEKGNTSIVPKFYYAGDFNGDGRMEILAISVDNPFVEPWHSSRCFLFDLSGNKILYKGSDLNFKVQLVGSDQQDPVATANNSDKLVVMDYDGDGKTDICLINDSGLNIYTFTFSNGNVSLDKIATDTGLTRQMLVDRELLVGEFNGDGLMDLLVSAKRGDLNNLNWTIYRSKGNGMFGKTVINGIYVDNDSKSGFFLQDVDNDGKTDLLNYKSSCFYTYFSRNNSIDFGSSHLTSFPTTGSSIVPVDINSHNRHSMLISLIKGTATKYSLPLNISKEVMATGMANSLGVIEKNTYSQLTDDTGNSYTKGYGASYPYVNIREPFNVLTSSHTFAEGKCIDNNSISYTNAIFHRQGLGFRGFEKITTFDKRGQTHILTYEPERFGVLKSEESPAFKNEFTYSVSTGTDHLTKIRLTRKKENDLLKGVSATTTYKYDAYGYPTEELMLLYPGAITVKKINRYSSSTNVKDGYNLGFLHNQETSITRSGSTYTEKMWMPAHSKRQPNVKIHCIDGNNVIQETFIYDSHGCVTKKTGTNYSSSKGRTTVYEYDSYGHLTKETDPMGLSTEYTYDSYGRVATMKDYLGCTTKYGYDSFGRETSVTYPDNTVSSTTYSWNTAAGKGLYSIVRTATGRPTETEGYDPLNREVWNASTRFDGTVRGVSREYDLYGNLKRESLPYIGTGTPLWNVYVYDNYDRPTSYTEASGRKTTWSYDGTKITTVEDNTPTTREYDSLGDLVSVTDLAGTITYKLAADSQPISITAPGDVTTTFTYDKYRRRIGLSDPSQGNSLWAYDTEGNVIKETDADGNVITHEYDAHQREIKRVTDEFTTTWKYNEKNQLINISSSNGTGKSLVYDAYGRLKAETEGGGGKSLRKDYTYSSGNLSSVRYTSQNGLLGTENRIYRNGCLSEVNLNGSTVIFKLNKENTLGLEIETNTGSLKRTYAFDPYGMPAGRIAVAGNNTYQNFSYTFDHTNSCLKSRTDRKRSKTEYFSYDRLNRLISYESKKAAYDIKGNITSRSDVGTMEYSNPDKPYALTGLTPSSDAVPPRTQNISYTSFHRPAMISENGCIADFTYNADFERVKMFTAGNSKNLTRYYLGGCYEADEISGILKERLYLYGGYYDSPAVLIKEGGTSKVYYILRDYLGSITHVVGADGTLVQELSYDAWGRLRNPATHEVYAPGKEPTLFLGRGYTGHEHLTDFGLINMNARLYDPALGRFLSPDPFVQESDLSQNFNRYTYAMNNPLCYVDEDGEFFWAAVGIAALVGGIVNVATHWKEIKATGGWKGFWKGAGYFAIGGIAGGAGMAVGIGAAVGFGHMLTTTAAGYSLYTTGFLGGAYSGAMEGLTQGFIQGTGNALIEGENLGTALGMGGIGALSGGVSGGLTGGVMSGIKAVMQGKNFWNRSYNNKTLVQKAADFAESNINATGHAAGSRKHKVATDLLKKHQKFYIPEERWLKFHVKGNLNGKNYFLDVLDEKGKMIYDWKFGYPKLTPAQLNETRQMKIYRDIWKIPSTIIKPKK